MTIDSSRSYSPHLNIFNNDTCPVCQEEYTTGKRVHILACRHLIDDCYHKLPLQCAQELTPLPPACPICKAINHVFSTLFNQAEASIPSLFDPAITCEEGFRESLDRAPLQAVKGIWSYKDEDLSKTAQRIMGRIQNLFVKQNQEAFKSGSTSSFLLFNPEEDLFYTHVIQNSAALWIRLNKIADTETTDLLTQFPHLYHLCAKIEKNVKKWKNLHPSLEDLAGKLETALLRIEAERLIALTAQVYSMANQQFYGMRLVKHIKKEFNRQVFFKNYQEKWTALQHVDQENFLQSLPLNVLMHLFTLSLSPPTNFTESLKVALKKRQHLFLLSPRLSHTITSSTSTVLGLQSSYRAAPPYARLPPSNFFPLRTDDEMAFRNFTPYENSNSALLGIRDSKIIISCLTLFLTLFVLNSMSHYISLLEMKES